LGSGVLHGPNVSYLGAVQTTAHLRLRWRTEHRRDRTGFLSFRQGTKSIATYITKYNNLLALLPNICKYVCQTLFRADLNQAFKDAIIPMPGQETMTLVEFQMECRRYKDQAAARRHASLGTRYNLGGNRQASNHPAPRNHVAINTTVAPPAAAAANSSTATPMELDAGRMRRNDPRVTGATSTAM
jgi:hypothetical protein